MTSVLREPAPIARVTALGLEPQASVRPRRWSMELFGAAYDRLDHDDGDGLAAGLAFGALLSLAPLLLIVVGVTSMILGEGAARDQIEELAGDSLGQRSIGLVGQWIDDARAWSGGATVIGVVMFVIGSARLVGLVDGAFKVVFDVDAPAKKATLLRQVRLYFTTQLKTLGVTLGAGVLMVASLVLRAIGESVFGGEGGLLLDGLWLVGREVISFAMWTGALALAYWALPPLRLNGGDIFHGALVSALLVEVTLIVLRVGASFFDFGAAYGTAGAIIGTLVTLYIVSQLFLFGAELTAELASRRSKDVRSSRDGCPRRVVGSTQSA